MHFLAKASALARSVSPYPPSLSHESAHAHTYRHFITTHTDTYYGLRTAEMTHGELLTVGYPG